MKFRKEATELTSRLPRKMVLEKNHEEFILDERDRFRPSELIQHKLQLLSPAHRLSLSNLHVFRNLHRPDSAMVH